MREKLIKLTNRLQLSNGGHILYIYDDLDRYIENAASYIAMGIEQGHHLFLIDNRYRYERISAKLQSLLSPQRLTYIHYVDSYTFFRVYGDFHCDSILNHFAKIFKPFAEQGLSVRTWAHVEWGEQDGILEKVDGYEKVADHKVREAGLISVCAYSGHHIPAALQNAMLRTHEYFMTDQEVVKSNLYPSRAVVFPSLSEQQEHQSIMERDQQEHRVTQGRLRSTKHQLESFITGNLDPILIFNEEDKLIRVNYAFEKVFGWAFHEVVGLSAMEMPFIPDDRKYEIKRNRTVTVAGLNIEGYESVRRRKDGSELHVMVSAFPLRDEEDQISGRAVIIRDITERKQAQELLIRSEKLSIAGELAAGIAHEIRNPVTTVKGFLQLLQSGNVEKHKYYEIMASEIARIELILSELLMLAKPQAVLFQPKPISLLINDVVMLLDAQANMNNVKIVTQFDADDDCVHCEENQIKQVCINIIKNAIEAMPEGGELLIQLEGMQGELWIRFIDQGRGIPKHVLCKLGQPFYTTKEKGTGLGFMVSKKIIENHNGSMHVYSEEEKGTTIEIRLSLSNADA